jgi:hypothetical protein
LNNVINKNRIPLRKIKRRNDKIESKQITYLKVTGAVAGYYESAMCQTAAQGL